MRGMNGSSWLEFEGDHPAAVSHSAPRVSNVILAERRQESRAKELNWLALGQMVATEVTEPTERRINARVSLTLEKPSLFGA
jgi:hypothetical protein